MEGSTADVDGLDGLAQLQEMLKSARSATPEQRAAGTYELSYVACTLAVSAQSGSQSEPLSAASYGFGGCQDHRPR